MYIAVPEDEEGMWYDDPIAADSLEYMKLSAKLQWQDLPEYITVKIYHCVYVCDLGETNERRSEETKNPKA